jgi:hypothetical protein
MANAPRPARQPGVCRRRGGRGDGKLLMRDRRLLTIDLPAVKAEVARRLARLKQRAAEKRLATYPIQG